MNKMVLGLKRKVFDDCNFQVSTEGRFKAETEIVDGSLFVRVYCKTCKACVYELERTDLKTRIIEGIRQQWDGYVRKEEDGSLTHVHGTGLRGAVEAGLVESEVLFCSRCGTQGILSFSYELTDEAFKRLQEYRLHGKFYALHGGLIELELEVFGARFFPRGSCNIQCKCNAQLTPNEFPKIFNNFGVAVTRYLQDGTPLPEPVEVEETLVCPVCLNHPQLIAKISAKVPSKPHKFARAVVAWLRRQPLYSRSTTEQILTES